MISKFFDTLANMGIWIRLNDTQRTQPPTEEGRTWGPTADGFTLSLAALKETTVSLLIKNVRDAERRVRTPGWLNYMQVQINGPGDAAVLLKTYGKQLLEAEQRSPEIERVFGPAKYLTTEIPLGALYDLRAPGVYRITVSCRVPGGSEILRSNEATITIP